MVNFDLSAADDRVAPRVPDPVAAFFPGGAFIYGTPHGGVRDVQVVAPGIGRQVEIRPVDPVGVPRGLLPERVRQGEAEIPGLEAADQHDFARVFHGLGIGQVEDAFEVVQEQAFPYEVEAAVPHHDAVDDDGFLSGQVLQGEADGRHPDPRDGVAGLEEGGGERRVVGQDDIPDDEGLEGKELHAPDGQFAVDVLVQAFGQFAGQGRLDRRELQGHYACQEQEQQRGKDAREDMTDFRYGKGALMHYTKI